MSVRLSGNGCGDAWCRAMDLQFQASSFELQSSSFRHRWRLIKAGGVEFSRLCHGDRRALRVAVSVDSRQSAARVEVSYRLGRGCGFGPWG